MPGADYAASLLTYIDAENLPASLGGKCTCDELGGCSLSSAGPWLEGRVYKGHGKSGFRAGPGEGSTEENSLKPVEGQGLGLTSASEVKSEKPGDAAVEPEEIKHEEVKRDKDEPPRTTEVQPNGNGHIEA